MSYRKELWNHKPLTSFWRIGKGIAQKLEQCGLDTMGKVARCSLKNEELLYSLFGVNAELPIDHAWGWEPVGMKEVKAYKPDTNSISSGQVLTEGYDYKKALVVVLELADEDSEILNQKMAYLREVVNEHPTIVVTYFEPDKKKAGGAYRTIEGQLQNIDEYAQCLVMKDGKVVFIRSVLDISVSGY